MAVAAIGGLPQQSLQGKVCIMVGFSDIRAKVGAFKIIIPSLRGFVMIRNKLISAHGVGHPVVMIPEFLVG